jgi:protoheme IX farnesyltransferase
VNGAPVMAAAMPARARSLDWVALGKPRILAMVLFVTAAGFLYGRPVPVRWDILGWTLLGTALVTWGAGALNMTAERDTDAKMRRTCLRPVAAGRIRVRDAQFAGGAVAYVGISVLLLCVGLEPAALALAAIGLYVFVYTPMKRATSLAAVVGAVPGAIPPVIGWTAAHGHFGAGAAVLFAILFMWQLPHFLSLGWLYRDDYARAGIPALPVHDTEGHATARQVLVQTAGLVLISFVPVAAGLAAGAYALSAALLGGGLLVAAAGFALRRTDRWARWLFRATMAYLPLILAVLVVPDWMR